MNTVIAHTWIGNCLWSLPLIIATVILHTYGLALIGRRGARALGGEIVRNIYIPKFAHAIASSHSAVPVRGSL